MKLPDAFDKLVNDYEKRQIGLYKLFSTTYSQECDTNSGTAHAGPSGHRTQVGQSLLYGMFGLLAVSEEDIRSHSKKPESDRRVQEELKWLKKNDHL